MVTVDEEEFDFKRAALLIRTQAETIFASRVKEAEDVKIVLARIALVGKTVPRARGSVQVRSIDEWFESYRKQIVWDVARFEEIVDRNQRRVRIAKEAVSDELKVAIQDINTELGLVELSLTDYASNRVNVSRPLQTTQRYVATLKSRLKVIAADSLAASVSQSFELVFQSADAERALNDDLGSVAFQQENNLIEIAPGREGERADLRALVADALADVSDPGLLKVVDQRNRQAADFVRVYAQRFEANSPESDLLLYSSGVKISQAMSSLTNPEHEDERVPQNFLNGLGTLIVHHEAYIWSVPRIREVIELRRKTLESYSPTLVTRSNLQSSLLEGLGRAEDMVGPRTRATIADINEPVQALAQVGVGLEAMQYGLLRGALQFMGRAIVQARKAAIQVGQATAKKVVVGAIATAVVASPLYPPIERFFGNHLEKLVQLAASAHDWGWLQYVLQIMRITLT